MNALAHAPQGPSWRLIAELIDAQQAFICDLQRQDVIYQNYLADHRLSDTGAPLSLRAYHELAAEHRALVTAYRYLPLRSCDPRDETLIDLTQGRLHELERLLCL